jgi:hypothetical protein
MAIEPLDDHFCLQRHKHTLHTGCHEAVHHQAQRRHSLVPTFQPMVARSARHLRQPCMHWWCGRTMHSLIRTQTPPLPSTTENHRHPIHHIQPTPQPPLSSSPPRNILFQVANDATSLHVKQRRVQKRLVCDVSWGKLRELRTWSNKGELSCDRPR